MGPLPIQAEGGLPWPAAALLHTLGGLFIPAAVPSGCPTLSMALLDDLIGGVVSAVAGDKAPAFNDFLKSNGGLSGLAEKFQNGGAGELFASWVGTGDNKAITTQQINAVLGNSQVQEFAKKLGIDTDAASTFIATSLPALIDKITPDGKVEPDPAAQVGPTA